jgi:hypothetical protein
VIFSWNNFVFGIVPAGRETRTLPAAVYNMISFDQLSWGPLAAAAERIGPGLANVYLPTMQKGSATHHRKYRD